MKNEDYMGLYGGGESRYYYLIGRLSIGGTCSLIGRCWMGGRGIGLRDLKL